jgi:hypothetical protein
MNICGGEEAGIHFCGFKIHTRIAMVGASTITVNISHKSTSRLAASIRRPLPSQG